MKKLEFKNQLSKMIKTFDTQEDWNFGTEIQSLTEGELISNTEIQQDDDTIIFIALIKNPKYIPTPSQINHAMDWGNHCLSAHDAATVTYTSEGYLKITWNNEGHI